MIPSSGVSEATGRTRYFSTPEIAEFLGITSDGVRKLIASGRLPCERERKAGGRKYYLPNRDEVLSYLASYDPALLPEFYRRWP